MIRTLLLTAWDNALCILRSRIYFNKIAFLSGFCFMKCSSFHPSYSKRRNLEKRKKIVVVSYKAGRCTNRRSCCKNLLRSIKDLYFSIWELELLKLKILIWLWFWFDVFISLVKTLSCSFCSVQHVPILKCFVKFLVHIPVFFVVTVDSNCFLMPLLLCLTPCILIWKTSCYMQMCLCILPFASISFLPFFVHIFLKVSGEQLKASYSPEGASNTHRG